MLANRRSTGLLLVGLTAAATLLAGCPGPGTPAASSSASTQVGDVPSASPPAAAPSPAAKPSASPKASPAGPAGPSCASVRGAMVKGTVDPYNTYGDGVPLLDGMWSGEDGMVLAVQKACASGDLGPGIGNTTLATIMSSMVDTTGRFWGLMLCAKGAERPICSVRVVLNDRDPIVSVSIKNQKATVVYLTRSGDLGGAAVNLKRTAIYQYKGGTLVETSHTDQPYTP